MAPLLKSPAMQKMMPSGWPATVPCQTAIITPRDSTTREVASSRPGTRCSMTTESRQATTGMADLRGAEGWGTQQLSRGAFCTALNAKSREPAAR